MKVALCTPCYDGRVHDEYASSLVNTMIMAAQRDIEIVSIMGRGSPILPDIRNWCVAEAMAMDCDKVWFVDSDISWFHSVPEVLNMMCAPTDIVCAVHQKRNTHWNSPAELVVHWDSIPPRRDEEMGLYVVSRVATAFLMIDRCVFEAMAKSGLAPLYLPHNGFSDKLKYEWYRAYFWYDLAPPKQLNPAVREHMLKLGLDPDQYLQMTGEDFLFCDKAAELGFKMLVDPRIRLTHFDGCVQHNVGVQDVEFQGTNKEGGVLKTDRLGMEEAA